MEPPPPPPRIPFSITKTYFTLQRKLQEIEAEIIQFINLPIDAENLDVLARRIQKKLVFFRNLLTTEIASYGSISHQFAEFEARLVELEAEFLRRNSSPVNNIHENEDSDSDNGSVCESCLNNDREVQIEEAGSQKSSGYQVPETLFDAVVPPPPPSEAIQPVAFDGEEEKGGGRRWWRTVAVVILTVSFWSFFKSNSHEDLMIPT